MKIRLVVNNSYSESFARGSTKECWYRAYSVYRFYAKTPNVVYYAEFEFHPVNSLALHAGDRMIMSTIEEVMI